MHQTVMGERCDDATSGTPAGLLEVAGEAGPPAVASHRRREEQLVHALMGRLWEAAEYPSRDFEPAWRRWLAERSELLRAADLVGAAEGRDRQREQEVREIVWAVADELCGGAVAVGGPGIEALTA